MDKVLKTSRKVYALAAGLAVPACGLIALLVWTMSPASAQPTVANLAVDSITHSSARITWTSSPATNRQIVWDTKTHWDANHTYRYKTPKWNNYQTTQKVLVTGLTPSTTYVGCPLACDANANCVTCTESGNTQVEFTTDAEPSLRPRVPTLPNLGDFGANFPQADVTLTVTSCTDLQTKINAAAGATYADRNVHVAIPAGMTCSYGTASQGHLLLPAKAGSGWIVIRTNGTLPPAGTRLDPDFDAQLAVFSNTAGGNDGFIDFSGPSHHYWFSGIKITHPAIASENDVAGTTGYQRTLLTMATSGVHDIVFDRTYWHFRGYPDRGLMSFFVTRAYNIAILDSYFDNAAIWRAYQDGIAVTHTTAAKNEYRGGTVYFGNASASVGAFSVALSGSGTGHFRLYAERNGDVIFKHDIATLTATCTGCTSSYDATLAVPVNAFKLMAIDDTGNTAITNAQFKTSGGTATGSPWIIQDGSDSGAGWEGGFNIYIGGTVHNLRVHNTYLGATGIGVYSEGGSADVHDLEFTRNTFQSDPSLYVPTAGDSNRYGLRRQHFELKTGYNVLLEGNQFLDAWVGASGAASPAVYLANRYDTTTGDAVMHDITIKNNLILRHPACFTTSGTESTYPHDPFLHGLLIENNVCTANAYERKQFDISTDAYWYGGFRGHQIELTMGCEDCTIRHNTFYGGLGGQPSFLRLTDLFYDNLVVQDNIFFLQRSPGGAEWGEGLQARKVYVDEAGVPAIEAVTEGEAGLSLAAIRVPSTPSWTFNHNVILAGCASAASCSAETSGSALLDVNTKQAIYPSGNFWPTGSTYGARIAAVGFSNPSMNNYRLSSESVYRAGGGFAASDNRDIGALYDELESKLGLVQNIRIADVGRSAAILQYTAPDGAACTVEYGTLTTAGSGARALDHGGPRQRQVVLAGLTPGTQYNYRIMCATRTPQATFWTQAGAATPTTIPLRLPPPVDAQVSEALVEYGPTSTLGSITTPANCGAGCTIEIPATGGEAVFHRIVYRDTAQAVLALGAVSASIGH